MSEQSIRNIFRNFFEEEATDVINLNAGDFFLSKHNDGFLYRVSKNKGKMVYETIYSGIDLSYEIHKDYSTEVYKEKK